MQLLLSFIEIHRNELSDDPRFSTVTFYSNRFGISDSATAMRALNQSVNNYTDAVMKMQTIIQDESR